MPSLPCAAELHDLSGRLARLAAAHRAAPIVTVDWTGESSRQQADEAHQALGQGRAAAGVLPGRGGEAREQGQQALVQEGRPGGEQPGQKEQQQQQRARSGRTELHEDWELL